MKAKNMMKIINCMAVSGILSLTACQAMAMDRESTQEGKNHLKLPHANNEILTDNRIIKVLSTTNHGEIKQAKTALPKLKADDTRKYAQMMINEHSSNETKVQELASRLQLTPQVSHTSTSLQKNSDKIVSKLTKSSNTTIDKDYMMSQVKEHRKVLMLIDKQLIPNTNNSDLKSMLAQTRTTVAKHLQTAKQILIKINEK